MSAGRVRRHGHRRGRRRLGDGRRRDGHELLADVDADRAPRDAAATPDAAGHPELVPPGAELVGQPLAVAVLDARPEVAAGHPGEAEGEAAVPGPLGDRLEAVEVGGLGDARAEAGRADERAVGAGQAALGDLRPARAVRGGDEPGRQPGRRDRVADPSRAAATAARAADRRSSSAGARSSRASSRSPAGVPARTTKPSSSSVIARSKPAVTSGPVPIEVQKHVSAGVTHSTAMTRAAARRAA